MGIDLFARHVVGWSMKPMLACEILLDSLLMATWRRRPKQEVILHCYQCSEYSNDDCLRFLKKHNLKANMSGRNNCYDNAMAQAFFTIPKKERIKRKINATRTKARTELFDYIDVFYNRTHPHNNLDQVNTESYETGSMGS